MNPIERELAAISERALNIYQGVLVEDSIRLPAGQKEQADPDWLHGWRTCCSQTMSRWPGCRRYAKNGNPA